MNRFRQVFLIVFLMAECINLQAQNAVNISLQEAKQYAIQFNKDLKKSGLSIAEAKYARWEAISAGLPQAKATYSYQNMLGYTLDFGPMGNIKMDPTSSVQIQATQLLFSANYGVGIKLAQLAEQMSVLSYKKSELDICKEVAESYHSILVTKELQKILGGNLINLKELQKKTLTMVQVGVTEQTNADLLSVQVASMENNIKSNERQLEVATNLLRLQLGLDANAEVNLTDNLESFINEDSITNLMVEPFNMQSNYNILLLNKSVQMAQKEVCMAKSNFLPTISGYYNFTHKISSSAFDTQPTDIVGITASMPLFTSGTNYSKVKQAKFKLQSAQLDKQNISDQLNIQGKQLRFNLKNAYETYSIQKQNIEVSTRVFQNISRKYEHGMASGLDLTNANNNLLSAEGNYISSIMQLLNAETELNNLLGKK